MKTLLIFFPVLFTLLATQDKTLYQTENEIDFTPADNNEKIVVTISGEIYSESKFDFSIISADNKTIYSFSNELNNLLLIKEYAEIFPEEEVKTMVKDFADNMVKNCFIGYTNQLPEYLGQNDYYAEYYEEINVSKEKYNELRKHNYTLISHQSYYEGYVKIYYDPTLDKVVTLITGGT